jgi:stearoyl-CoA desaturase (delta-9 desaturase)
VIRHEHLRRVQWRHFILFDVSPLVTLLLVVPFWGYLKPRWFDLGLLAVFYTLSAIGVTVGLHRYFTHRSFKTSRPGAAMLAALAMTAGTGTVLLWAGIHRMHHAQSDRDGDPHSPNMYGSRWLDKLRSLARSGGLADWATTIPTVRPGLAEGEVARSDGQAYVLWRRLALPALLALLYEFSLQSMVLGFVWGGMVRMCVLKHAISSVNSICHMVGTRPFQTYERSTNFGPLAILTMGESWHNNHHAFQASATFQYRWWQIDPGHMTIVIAESLGLVWDVRRPEREHVLARLDAGRVRRVTT